MQVQVQYTRELKKNKVTEEYPKDNEQAALNPMYYEGWLNTGENSVDQTVLQERSNRENRRDKTKYYMVSKLKKQTK